MPLATGGSILQTVSSSVGRADTYNVHVFTSSGNLVVSEGGSVEYLVVGAGGGGGSAMGGGGGAGGFLTGNVTLTPGTYTVTIGAGGTGAPAGLGQVRGSTGASSSIVPFNFKGHSYSFDGAGDGVNCGTQSAYALGAGAFCLEGWIYNHRLKNYSTLWTTRPDNGGYADAYHIGWDGAGGVSLYVGSTSYAGGAAGTIKAGQWQHIAITRNASGNLATFVDGIRVGYTASLTTNFTRTLLGLGDFPTTKAESIDGYISNARIVVGNAVYDPTLTTCTVPTAPLTAIAGTAILTAQDLSFRDNSTNNFTLTAQGNSALSHFSPFHSLGAAGGGGGASSYDTNANPASSGSSGGGVAGSSSTTNGLGIAGQGFAGGTSGGSYYPSGGGGAAAAGTTNPGNGGAGRPSSILGTTYYWSGGGGGAGYSGNAGNGGIGGGGGGAPKVSGGGLAGGSAYSPASDGTVGTLNSQTNVPGGNGGNNTGGGGGGGAHYNSNNFGGTGGSGIVILKYVSSTVYASAGGQGGPNAGGGGGGGNDGYIGATQPYAIKVFTSSGNLNVTGTGTIEYLVVGGGGGGGSDMGGGGGGGGYVAGTTTLTTGTYTVTVGAGGTGGPAGTDQVRANSGNSSGIVPFGYKGHSIIFDSTGDYITVPAQTALSFDTGDFTIEGWIYLPAAPSGYAAFIDGRNATSDAYAFGVNSSLKLDFYYGTPGRVTSTSSVVLNQWNHCAVSRSGGTIRLFINGVLDATTGSYASAVNATRAAPLIGALIDPGFFSGLISNFRVIKGSALYTSSFSSPTQPLTAVANTSVLLAQDLAFTDNSSNNFTVTPVGNATVSHFTPFSALAVGAAGGGGGASDHSGPVATSAAAFGGSGGGASGNNANNGLGIAGQGNAGAASAGSWYPGGGGGAGGAGSTNPANGGNGVQNAILGTSYYWAAGGGGAGYSANPGNGGLGGGGGGAPKQSSTAGVAGTGGYTSGTDGTVGSLNSQTNVPGGNGGTNTGSGGGGGAHYSVNNQGGTGGSGIVIIKYKADELAITGGTITTTVFQLQNTFAGGLGANGAGIYAGTTGTLGGGGGGGSSATVAGGGGGVGINGPANVGGTAGTANGGPGGGGSGGLTATGANGGLYGGGGGGTTNSVLDPAVGNGAGGALKIVWAGNILQYPYPVQANNVVQLNSSTYTESLESGVTPNQSVLSVTTVPVLQSPTANNLSALNIDPVVGANLTFVTGVTTVNVGKEAVTAKNIAVQELQIITYRTDEEMMLITVKNTGGYTDTADKIERITKDNDPRRIEARLLNYIVGVTGEDNDIIQTQIWF